MNHVFMSQQKMIWNWLLEFYHDCFNKDHWDRNKILNDIHEYIMIYSVCQSKIIHHYWFYNQLKSLSILKNTWNSSFKEISLNWIMRLSLSMKMKNDQKYNSILTVVCCITKYALFIFIQNDTTTANFVKLFFKHVECYFDFSRSIMMNKNSCIISDFWWEVCEIEMIKW